VRENMNKHRRNLSNPNQTLVQYPVKASGDFKKATNCLFIALYFGQFFSYGFDKKGLGSQDIQDIFRLCRSPTRVT
jgi:hypothetical protein